MKLNRLLALAFAIFATLAQAEPGMLRITTSPGDAQIFVNGQRKGNSPSQEGQTFALKLPQGDYTVEARKSDGKDYYFGKKSVFVANDSLQTVDISLAEAVRPYGQMPNGSVKVAGREWLRCSIGQSWSGNSCNGEALKNTFEEAKIAADTFNATGYGGKRDWRVPTVRELAGLIQCSSGKFKNSENVRDGGDKIQNTCDSNYSKPTIDTSLFPQTPESWFWSASPNEATASRAWYVYFGGGSVYYEERANGYYVRLVR
jgi:Protein of unknown function (DUF1566)